MEPRFGAGRKRKNGKSERKNFKINRSRYEYTRIYDKGGTRKR